MRTNDVVIAVIRKWVAGAFLGLSLFCAQAHAFIEGSMICGTSIPNSQYVFEPGENIKIALRGNCRIVRVFPYGAALNVEFTRTSGANAASLNILSPYSNMYMYPYPLGNAGPECLGGSCIALLPNGALDYTYYIVGKAPVEPGTRTVTIRLGITAVGFPAYAEWLHTFNLRYSIVSKACTLSSPAIVNLFMGSFGSGELNSKSQSTGITVNCPSSRVADVYVTPTQQAVNTTSGISRTTLSGLNMQALWSDTSTAVNFTSPRRVNLRAGGNSLGLTFRPQLSGGSPAGAFQAGYTLVINYL
ncbi:fimbrial protein [Pseudomonas cichorii]|uniref:fimbrial protein n=1 Tax=Pseudomonas cichorii TaxID=36746 RepID=UPI0018E5B541|nr:fimbrial protein [Pseudomonas cichorii]MBI6853148.1 fimbrial protein [Pseudomonas cichorii]